MIVREMFFVPWKYCTLKVVVPCFPLMPNRSESFPSFWNLT